MPVTIELYEHEHIIIPRVSIFAQNISKYGNSKTYYCNRKLSMPEIYSLKFSLLYSWKRVVEKRVAENRTELIHTQAN